MIHNYRLVRKDDFVFFNIGGGYWDPLNTIAIGMFRKSQMAVARRPNISLRVVKTTLRSKANEPKYTPLGFTQKQNANGGDDHQGQR